jgi:hypothetical protein
MMENGPGRADYWIGFILDHCHFPSIERLREQFKNCQFTTFCDCGCNSFGLKIADGTSVRPLLPPILEDVREGHWSIYEADFLLVDGKSLEIILFADRKGNLAYVEIDYCANAYPVPEKIEVTCPPYHSRGAEALYS